VQATVSAFDEATRGGRVLLDDGAQVSFSAAALEGSDIRLLRAGQRVRLDTVREGGTTHVVAVRIITMP
jgi:cold shock CspA family protein